ncbi:hypothetical protein BaRGS_00003859 [Batillaria attramentaria]|uniref:Secreted protein n=1 Tax=Batillaria attramentaria TaxID=370345 RepID=A0ABD0M004_9CAEN
MSGSQRVTGKLLLSLAWNVILYTACSHHFMFSQPERRMRDMSFRGTALSHWLFDRSRVTSAFSRIKYPNTTRADSNRKLKLTSCRLLRDRSPLRGEKLEEL